MSVGPHLISVITVLWAFYYFYEAEIHILAYNILTGLKFNNLTPTMSGFAQAQYYFNTRSSRHDFVPKVLSQTLQVRFSL